jgi:Kef-type K+ transport system membrane component KefB
MKILPLDRCGKLDLCALLLLLLQVMGMLFESIKQPVINGYLVAGAIVGPGGLQLIKELVQVCARQRVAPTL